MNLFVRLLPVSAFAAALIAPSASFAAVTHCDALFFDSTATVPTQQTTTSQTFVNLPGAAINFSGGADDCVIVQFSAQARAKLPQKVRIRAVLNGETVAFPLVEWSTPENQYDGRSATFIFPSVPSGDHTVRIQFLSVEGGTVAIAKGLMVVRFNGAT